MTDAQVLFNKILEHDYILKLDRGMSTEYFYAEENAYGGDFYSIVVNTEDVVSDYGETEEKVFAKVCEDCEEGQEYEVIAPTEFLEEMGLKLLRGETDFAHKFGGA